ncbi:MAG: hypothetical protein Q7S59_02100, partial [Sulfurimonas sp.]|nr:hypothetical protein [Sulfurimonas sp.]
LDIQKKLSINKRIEKDNIERQEDINALSTNLYHDIGTNCNKLLTLMNPVIRRVKDQKDSVYFYAIRIYGMEYFKKHGLYYKEKNKQNNSRDFNFPIDLITEDEAFFKTFVADPTSISKIELLNLLDVKFKDIEKELNENSCNSKYVWFIINDYYEKTFSKIVYKLLSNAFKHAILDSENKILLELKMDNGYFEIIIGNTAESTTINQETIEKELKNKKDGTLNNVASMCQDIGLKIKVNVADLEHMKYITFTVYNKMEIL